MLRSAIHTTCCTHLMLLNLITEIILGEGTSYIAPHLVIFSSLLLISSLLNPNIFLSTLFSDTFSLCSSLSVRDNLHTHTKDR